MALTLPNPSMNFVPLDVLTAEELNQFVENIDFLANQFPLTAANIESGAITSTKIAAGAVRSSELAYKAVGISEIDLSSTGPLFASNDNNTTISSNWTRVLSLDVSRIPQGTNFLVVASLGVNTQVGSNTDITLAIEYPTSTYAGSHFQTAIYWQTVETRARLTRGTNTTVRLAAKQSVGSGLSAYTSLMAVPCA